MRNTLLRHVFKYARVEVTLLAITTFKSNYIRVRVNNYAALNFTGFTTRTKLERKQKKICILYCVYVYQPT